MKATQAARHAIADRRAYLEFVQDGDHDRLLRRLQTGF